jgi:hypothetical protein
LVESNAVLTEIKDALLQPGDENLVLKLKRLLDEVGVSSETIKNLSISAMLNRLGQSTENPELLQQIDQFKALAEKYGLGDLKLSV